MTYTGSPQVSTYSTERIQGHAPYVVAPNEFATLSGMTNLIAVLSDEGEKKIYAETRFPIKAVQVDSTTTANISRGCYVWEKTASAVYYFAVFGVKVYTSTTGAAGSWTAVTTLTTVATTPVGFTEFIDGTNTKKLVLVDGVEGYVFTTNAAGTKIVDADFPTPHLPYPVFIDGFLFLAKAATGDIYNSDLNDPAVWTAGSFISSELYPDDITAIVKVNNYLLAVGKLGCEYFYDAANATASPLARYAEASLPFGCPIPTSIASNKDTVTMLCNSSDGTYTLRVITGFKNEDITPNWLAAYLTGVFSAGSVFTPAMVRGYFMRFNNELCYIFQVVDTTSPSGASIAKIFAFSTGTWSLLNYGAGFGWPITASAFGSSSNTITYIQGNTRETGHTVGRPVFGTFGTLSFTTDAVDDLNYTASPAFQTNIPTELQTASYDFSTMNLKTMSRFGVYCEINSNAVTSTTNLAQLYLSWNDRPFTGSNTYSTQIAFPQIPVAEGFAHYPFITQLGMFRQRSFKLTYANTYPIRYKWFEVDINKGQQ